jgi:hypothetical protein
MTNWFRPANYFVTNVLIFLLGLHGITFFKWFHAIISAADAVLFGTICTTLCAIVIFIIQWKNK